MAKRFSCYFLFFLFFFGNTNAQIDKSSELFLELKKQDSIFFERGFNNCDMAYLEKSMDDNLKFYHDKGGFQDKKLFLERTKENICSNPLKKPIRKVVPGSLEVFPLYDNGNLYGAIQTGEHQFYIREPDKQDVLGGRAKFTTVWTKKKGNWVMSDVLSYDHGEPNHAEIKDPIEKLLKDNNIPTLGLGIIENGKLTQIKVYGTLEGKTAAPYNSLFNVASLTKPVTAMTVLRLVSLGKWNLDESLDKYWIDPDIAKDPRHKKLTTRIILSHQTGFPNWRWQKSDHKLNFEFDPGSKYQYSGEGYEYLRKAVENKFHKSLEVLAKELVFEPLDMHDTSYIWNEKKDAERIVTGYDKNGKPYEIVKNSKPNAADDLMTSVEDYGKFLIAVMNNDLLSKIVFKEMESRQVDTKKNKYFGLGFEIFDLGNGEIALSHGGSDKGVNTIAVMLPKTKQGLVIFTNVDDGYKIYEPLINHYLGEAGKKIVKIETE
ncbi:CubicO group peptidase, beta-lactamase class C family [Chryseobacterium taichungense]|uniref:CubicO group peptidase, beta-lactamase class C family n=1 Tax=Chryseobacterium taichungense TaxID=295069 RepID=A0A1H8A764_9FLAO|nr:serine hydrolase [Chryseobacterium taichungense]SEM66540.1 CubicO group peptidase, beta-lactamase class C family [Chryseobacterium taichungense]